MKTLKKSFRSKFIEDIFIKLDRDYPTHIPVGIMIEIVFEASKKVGIDSYSVLKHCHFTEEEIRDYFERLAKRTEI